MKSNLRKGQKFYLFWKRIFDIFLSIIGILLCVAFVWWWVIIVNAIVTKGHPFFAQKRVGKNKKIFSMLKFRSMSVNANPNAAPSDMSENQQKSMVTPFGKFLRKSSIDETPQFLNIFIGQMSFVGPRPGAAVNEEKLIELRESYTPNAFDVKPGLTGYAQTRMGREHDPEQKAYLDHYYVTRMNLWLDFKILVYTFFKIFGVVKGR